MLKRESSEILHDIKVEIPEFEKDELLEYTKWAIPSLYESLRDNEKIVLNCNNEVINKINSEKESYRVTKNIDKVTVQYADLFDYLNINSEKYIKVYISLYFYDDVNNNIDKDCEKDKYWNDTWIITYKINGGKTKDNCNCSNCGSVMKYNLQSNIFECEYCGNVIHINSNLKWEIVDIQVIM